jgi:hypothetical protein
MSEAKTHVIDGKKYVEVERKAKVGEKIIMIDGDDLGYKKYDIFEVTQVIKRGVVFYDNDGDDRIASTYRYRVLEPVADEESTAPDLVELIANLSAEVTQLKRNHSEQLDTLFRNVQQLGEELASIQHEQSAAQAEKVDSTPVTLPKWLVDRLMGGYRG